MSTASGTTQNKYDDGTAAQRKTERPEQHHHEIDDIEIIIIIKYDIIIIIRIRHHHHQGRLYLSDAVAHPSLLIVLLTLLSLCTSINRETLHRKL